MLKDVQPLLQRPERRTRHQIRLFHPRVGCNLSSVSKGFLQSRGISQNSVAYWDGTVGIIQTELTTDWMGGKKGMAC